MCITITVCMSYLNCNTQNLIVDNNSNANAGAIIDTNKRSILRILFSN
jgi:hypothetical protein